MRNGHINATLQKLALTALLILACGRAPAASSVPPDTSAGGGASSGPGEGPSPGGGELHSNNDRPATAAAGAYGSGFPPWPDPGSHGNNDPAVTGGGLRLLRATIAAPHDAPLPPPAPGAGLPARDGLTLPALDRQPSAPAPRGAAAVPAPATIAVLAVGAIGLIGSRRRSRSGGG